MESSSAHQPNESISSTPTEIETFCSNCNQIVADDKIMKLYCKHIQCEQCFRSFNSSSSTATSCRCACCQMPCVECKSILEAIHFGKGFFYFDSTFSLPEEKFSNADKRERYMKAINYYKSAYHENKNNYFTCKDLGTCYFEAASLIHLENNGNMPRPGSSSAELREYFDTLYGPDSWYFKSVQLLEEAIDIQQECVDCETKLGLIYTLARNYSSALHHLENAVQINERTNYKDGHLLILYEKAKSQLKPLRFKLGTPVECLVNNGVWKQGIVIKHYYREAEFPLWKTSPYQIRL